MDKFPIGIIGGTGGIGSWFADFFRKCGYRVHVSGRKTGMDLPAMAKTCSVVIVSVPIGVTCETIRAMGPLLKEDALLMDLTSLKVEPVRVMLESSVSEVIGLHPLFGPDVPSIADQNIALCPARGEKWLAWIRDIFQRNGACLVDTTPQRHDEIMAVVQGLNHLNSIAMGLVLREAGVSPAELERFSTPSFRMKREIIDKVLSHPDLYAEIIIHNPEVRRVADLYEGNLILLKELVREGNPEAMIHLLKKKGD